MGNGDGKKKIAMVVSECSFDKALMPLILGSSGRALDAEVHIFFTFFGLNLLKKGFKPRLKGLMRPFTGMMIRKMKKEKVPVFEELIDQCRELGVKFYACSTSMKLMNVKKEDLIEGCEVAGAATFLKIALDADVTLFI